MYLDLFKSIPSSNDSHSNVLTPVPCRRFDINSSSLQYRQLYRFDRDNRILRKNCLAGIARKRVKWWAEYPAHSFARADSVGFMPWWVGIHRAAGLVRRLRARAENGRNAAGMPMDMPMDMGMGMGTTSPDLRVGSRS